MPAAARLAVRLFSQQLRYDFFARLTLFENHMDTSAIDFAALAAGALAAVVITGSIAWAARHEGWTRVWIAAAVVSAGLIALGWTDLARERPRETHIATVLLGVPLPVLGAVGMQRVLRRVRPWLRWSVVFLMTLVLLLLGVLVGGAIVPRWLSA